MPRALCAAFGLSCLLLVTATAPREAGAQGSGSLLRVGMPRTFFHDLPPVMIKIATDPFTTVIRNATGLTGELTVRTDAFTVARDLAERNVQIAVFHGFEYGWALQKHPELRPLMV